MPSAHINVVGATVGDHDGEDVGESVGALEVGEIVGALLGVGVLQTACSHIPLLQSVPKLHFSPAIQKLHTLPPQSTSVSVPSILPFRHVAGVGCWVGDGVGAGDGEREQSALVMQRALSHKGLSTGQ